MIIVRNSQLNKNTIEALNLLMDLDINAATAFKLSRIIKELTSIIDDKILAEKRILDKHTEKDDSGNPIPPLDEMGNPISGSVSIKDINEFTKEMSDLMNVENKINYDKIKFESLELSSSIKIKDLIKIEFLFE